MDERKLADEIRKLNLNPESTNTNHDTKLVNFFYNLKQSEGINLNTVILACEILKSENYREKITKEIESVAYYISLIN